MIIKETKDFRKDLEGLSSEIRKEGFFKNKKLFLRGTGLILDYTLKELKNFREPIHFGLLDDIEHFFISKIIKLSFLKSVIEKTFIIKINQGLFSSSQ